MGFGKFISDILKKVISNILTLVIILAIVYFAVKWFVGSII